MPAPADFRVAPVAGVGIVVVLRGHIEDFAGRVNPKGARIRVLVEIKRLHAVFRAEYGSDGGHAAQVERLQAVRGNVDHGDILQIVEAQLLEFVGCEGQGVDVLAAAEVYARKIVAPEGDGHQRAG